MSKRAVIIMILACGLLLGVIVFSSVSVGKKPYKNLNASEISSAVVRLTPPDKTILIPDTEELADYLRDVVIYKKDNSYTSYCGQGVTFTLTMADGTQTEIVAYNPFLVIDGVGYRTEYKPCEALNSYANRLLRQEDAVIVLDSPPILDVISDNTLCTAILGTYSWERRNNDGTTTAIEADSAHPLDCKDVLVQLDTTEETALLRFQKEPDAILSVRCWSDEYWHDPAAEGEAVTFNGDEIELKQGGYIYEVAAQWSTESGYGGGIARYSFYLVKRTGFKND